MATCTSIEQGHTASSPERIVSPLWRLVVGKASPITPLNDTLVGPSFYCVHPIAGDVSSFYPLAHHLDQTVKFYGIQVSREKMNGKFGSSIEVMARTYVDAILKHQPDGPLYVGGWSAGAIVALEIARQLCQAGRVVPLLVAFDGAPCNTGASLKVWNPIFAFKVLFNLPFWILDASRQAGSLHGLIEEVRTRLKFRLKRSQVTFKNDQTLHGEAVENLIVSKEWSEAQMAFIRAFYNALRSYIPRPYDGRILAIESRTQPLIYIRHVGQAWKRINPATEVIRLKGNHEGIFREPLLRVLVSHVRDRICVAPHEHMFANMANARSSMASTGLKQLDNGQVDPRCSA